ncbi:glutamate-5-semialdehyde dehydrogenase [Halanaerobium congolense]|jgi:glutamate-5-semialdehyde dehydrogenase|uniref:Gamma-glutamyl phosphate reductase n=1 Tax=Halanaerobium congolense TaxID=54121 RepID=A0A4R8GSB9_9FIRM|nr:glutamate-5-semialdehyde dehydrogenase [Halanaerobium congolense]KXS49605.1 MAG: glutamate-5-semialdehyde dehydrogenase [Halanaerobium sp. T82-1]PTX15494.1 glutamate-5-semialdehyde dehydrogenase [Halanaerobium congolense]TDS27724.1 glutamate-5-semialdehyde dehydrogenase [Halanaerobium congolense]TDX44567.1 glutamate-5-semialdehyde dehydrogenase [Halanaerobium congolense]SDF03736.1 glutamate-5-semialdehyde dehydrogenase [Halanaerobium congolense]
MSIREELISQAEAAKEAARKLAKAGTDKKNKALNLIADNLIERQDEILANNEKDMEKGRENDLSRALLDRLQLTESRIKGMAQGLREVAAQDDPIGEVPEMWRRPNGLQIGKIRVPLGVIGIIYEARPNVTVDVAGLCLKSGNTVILRGGSNAFNSNQILTNIIQDGLREAGLPRESVQLILTTDRKAVDILFTLNDYLDVLIPRGGAGLIQKVVNESKVPVIETGVGNCHVYVNKDADLTKAKKIVFNAKYSRPAVCNSAESLLVDQEIAGEFLPEMARIFAESNVELRGCERTRNIVPKIKKATEEDYATEYLDYIMSIKVVDNYEEAVEHIYHYGTKHSEAIITENYTTARAFLDEIDAAAVYVNASTRFTDGGQFGLGAETGISTQKLHARGPMGLKELTTTKYIIMGDGQIRE